MASQTIFGALVPRMWDALMQVVVGRRQRRQVLQGLLRNVEYDRDALSAFLYHVELGDESGHVISGAAGLDIWYDHLLATRELPDLQAGIEAEAVHQIRHSFSQQRDIAIALRNLLKKYERLPHYQQELRNVFAEGDGQNLWEDYLAWEEADKRNLRDQAQQWEERQLLARRWDTFKATSHVGQKRVDCRRAIIEAREQCEAIMQMIIEELALRPMTLLRSNTRGLV